MRTGVLSVSRSQHSRHSQHRMLRRRREKTSLILAAIVILFVFCQSLRLVFKMIEISLIEDHVSAEVFNFCARLEANGHYWLLMISKIIKLFLINNWRQSDLYHFRHGRHGVPSYLLCLSNFNHILLVEIIMIYFSFNPLTQPRSSTLPLISSSTAGWLGGLEWNWRSG